MQRLYAIRRSSILTARFSTFAVDLRMEQSNEDTQCREALRSRLISKPPLAKGHMFKQDSKGIQFNKRYFVLYEGVLLYYKHEESYRKDQKRGMEMKTCTIWKLDGLYLSKPPPTTVPRHCFILHLPDASNNRNEILLAASSRKSKNIWIEMFQSQNPYLLPCAKDDPKRKPAYIQNLRLRSLSLPGPDTGLFPDTLEERRRRETFTQRSFSFPSIYSQSPNHSRAKPLFSRSTSV